MMISEVSKLAYMELLGIFVGKGEGVLDSMGVSLGSYDDDERRSE